ncbi:MAG: pseudouridine synthase [Desulfosalsimonadaceae bacterium]
MNNQVMMRLQKYLSRAGVCSRRQAEALIREGKVQVNGRIVGQMGVRIDPEADRVYVDGRLVAGSVPEINIMLNKPAGYISSCRHGGRKVVLDLVDIPHRVYPAGRLDRESTGLLLLTNNGGLHYRLTHPSFDHEKEYAVKTQNPLSDTDLDRLAAGVMLEGRPTRPASIRRKGKRAFAIVLKEGRNRQIRRMVESLGNRVESLHRLRMATLCLGDLPPGGWRYLSEAETLELKRFCGL